METRLIPRCRVTSRWTVAVVAVLSGLGLTSSIGCNKMQDTSSNFVKAINHYYADHPSCLWQESVQFPVDGDPGDPRETARLNALVTQSLLTRSTVPPPPVVKPVAKGASTASITAPSIPGTLRYDLSSTGRSNWVADGSQPGFGNLCYGHRKAASIDSYTPTTSTDGATTTVVYRYTVKDVPDWAKTAEVQTQFRSLQTDLSGRPVGRATLTNTKDGWKVTAAPWAHIQDSDIYR